MSERHETPPLQWKDAFATGDASIDHEHREMIERINRVLGAIDTEAEPSLVFAGLAGVHAWISAHFALEEKLMAERGYDQLDIHKRDHERLLDDIREIMDDCRAGAPPGGDSALQQRLHDWFANHFKTMDARLHRHLAKTP